MSNVEYLTPHAPRPVRPEAKDPPAHYAELAVTSNFSFLRGASHPEELVRHAGKLGLTGLGIADRNSVAGVVRAHSMVKELIRKEKKEAAEEAAKEAAKSIVKKSVRKSIPRLAVGARLVFADGTPDILAYPSDRAAWGRLTRLLSVGKRRAEKADCILGLPDLLEFIEGLNLIVMPPARINAGALQAVLGRLKGHASPRSIWLGASMLYRGDDVRRLVRLSEIARDAFVPLIATNDVLYHAPKRRALQDIVTCIREHVAIETAGTRLEANAERHLKSPAEMVRLFRRTPEAIAQTQIFLDRCRFSLDELCETEYPHETRQGYATPQEALVAFAYEGARKRFKGAIPAGIRKSLDEELKVVGDMGYAPFFLTVYSIVRFAKSQGILCQGRGSAANSIICFCLGITEVNPVGGNLLFTRFISSARGEPPDIDVDFEHERREEIIQHIYKTYGTERAGIAATVISYRGRSAIRDVGKAMGLSEDKIGLLAKTLWGWSMQGASTVDVRRAGFDLTDRRLRMARSFARVLMGFPRHLSQHVGGFVITESRLDEVVPIANAAMDDRTFIEWDKDDLDALKLLKVDVLALGMLSCLNRAFNFLKTHYGVMRDLSDQTSDDATYRMIQRADTIGVFQIESRAQMSMLPRLKPKEFYDLVIEVAIVRPGPIQGDMVHPYLRRRQGLEKVSYPSPELENILRRTLGVPLFQEQAMSIAIVGAGFSPDKADELRRAMATFKRVGTIGELKHDFIEGMVSRNYTRDFAKRCFKQIQGFGEYGFPESHAASFANLVYASSWLKCRYPDVFAAALLNSQPMGFYAPAQIVRDAQEHGVAVRCVDINRSDWDCSLEPGAPAGERLHPRHASMRDDIRSTHALRLGFRQISGMSEDDGKAIERVRAQGFDSVRDFWLRTQLKPSVLERLASADAFDSLGLDRRDALWAVRALRRSGDKDDLPLFARAAMPELEPDANLPAMLPGQEVIEDYRRLHLSLKAHPMSFLRAELDRRSIMRHELLATMPSGRRVTVAGLVLVRQRPGDAKAIFMTLEDETGVANVIVWLKTFEVFRPQVMGARLVSVTGKLQNESGVIHIVADTIEDLTPLLRSLSGASGGSATDAAAAGSPPPIRGRHPRSGDALVTLFKDDPGLLDDPMPAPHPAEVMPKGRNFH